MKLDDSITLTKVISTVDAELNPVETETVTDLGKCCIVKNDRASIIATNDGKQYIFAYQIFMRKPKLIPDVNDRIHITKKDGTINQDCIVTDRVTLKNWLKIWV